MDVVDVTDHGAVRAALDLVLGPGRLTVVVWAAAIFHWAPAQDADPTAWSRLLDVNLTAAAVLTALVAPALRDHDVKVSLVSPGLVAAGAGLRSDAGQHRPQDLLAPDDVAAAVRFVVTFPRRGCPTEIALQPQRSL